jgi:hypothetical protein
MSCGRNKKVDIEAHKIIPWGRPRKSQSAKLQAPTKCTETNWFLAALSFAVDPGKLI